MRPEGTAPPAVLLGIQSIFRWFSDRQREFVLVGTQQGGKKDKEHLGYKVEKKATRPF